MKHSTHFNQNSGNGNKNSYNNNRVVTIGATIASIFFLTVVVLNFTIISNKITNFGADWFQKEQKTEIPQQVSLGLIKGDYLRLIAESGAPVRRSPSTLKGERIVNLKEGDIVEYLGEELVKDQPVLVNGMKVYGYWISVRTESGKEGWTFSGAYTRTSKPFQVYPSAFTKTTTNPLVNQRKKRTYDEIPLKNTYAVCNGDEVLYFSTPFGDLSSGTRLGHLNTGDRMELLARTAKMEEMTRRGVTKMAYRYKFAFFDKNGKSRFAWIKGIWLDLEEQQMSVKKTAEPPQTYEIAEVPNVSAIQPTLTFKQENKSTIAIYADKNLGAIRGHYYSNIYTRKTAGKLAIQVCTDKNGEVVQSMFLSPNSTIQEERLIKSMLEMVDNFKFSNKDCGLIEVEIFQGN